MHFRQRLGRPHIDGFLDTHRAAHEQRLAYYEELRASIDDTAADPYVLATLEFGLCHERAVLEWFERLDELLP